MAHLRVRNLVDQIRRVGRIVQGGQAQRTARKALAEPGQGDAGSGAGVFVPDTGPTGRQDRGGRHVVLRPEGTAGVIRYVASAGQEAQNARLYYIGPMFRCERPQAGRKRQFHQLGIELIGAPDPRMDAEVIDLQRAILDAWGISDVQFQLNTRGQIEERAEVTAKLRGLLEPHLGDLCEDCGRRYESNVLRVLDCKNPNCGSIVAGLPPITDLMNDESRAYFDQVETDLQMLGVEVERNPMLVRGLDYYVHTVWEVTSSALGAQDAIAGGGRYQIDLGGRTVEGVGFALGLERVLAVMQASGDSALSTLTRSPRVWLISQCPPAYDINFKLAAKLRRDGVVCLLPAGRKSMKAQMKAANRDNADYVVILGESELEKNACLLRNMADGTQEELLLDKLPEVLAALPPVGTP